MARVYLDNVTKRFPGVEAPAVDRVTIEAKDGEFLVLVGPSGCGKSTTLRMVAGLEDATEGEIHIGDRRVNDVAPKDRDIAMIFQNYALYPHMSVYQNMGFGLKMRKFPRDEIDRRVREAAETLGLTSYLDRKPKALSGGQRQRVAVGRAIVRRPTVFLFDEPLSNLDAKMRVQMRNEIRRLHRDNNATMIYVTHDQVEAMTLGDRIAVMNEGRVQQIDPPQALYDRPRNRFVAGFIGSPPMNFIEGALTEEGGELRFEEGTFGFALSDPMRAKVSKHIGARIVLGVRPEDIKEDSTAASGGTEARASVDAEIESIEPLGAEAVFYLRAGNSSLVARFPPGAEGRAGERKKVGFETSKVHFFDAASGERIE